MPKVSIVMSVFNREKYLEATLQSIVDQTFQDFELIIIDNLSSDNSPVIARKFAEKYSNIFYYETNDDISNPAALNLGFSKATGEYWTKMDSDDLYYPNAIGRMVEELDSHPEVDFVYCDIETIDADNKVIGYMKALPSDTLIFLNTVGCCILYRSSLAKKVGQYDEVNILVEDYDYWLRCNAAGVMKPINECLLQYRSHPENLSHRFEKEVIVARIKLQKKYYHQYIDSRRKAALFYAYVRSRDCYNPFRQFYLLLVLFYSPSVFFELVTNRKLPKV